MQPLRNRSRPYRGGAPCVYCRQMKTKCDAHDKFPAPCSSCEKGERRCYIDPSFKRTPKRERMKYMEKEVQELQETLRASNVKSDDALPGGNGLPPMSLENLNLKKELEYAIELLKADAYVTPPRALESISLDSFAVADLLEEYYEHYHNQFPLLQNPSMCVNSYKSCPMLFWMVMAIASKTSEKHLDLYNQLEGPIKRLAEKHTAPTSRSIYFVQALLLLCVWPFPFKQVIDDPSWLYCGLATHMATLLGLHRPQHIVRLLSALDAEIGDFVERSRTWIACFIVDQMTSVKLGIPTTLKADRTILLALSGTPQEIALPDVTESQLHIAYIGAKCSTLLGEYENSSTGLFPAPLPLVRSLDTEYSIIYTRYHENWSCGTEIIFLGARLNLYAYILSHSLSGSPASTPGPQGQDAEFVTLGSNTAVHLLHLVCTSPSELIRGMTQIRYYVVYAVLFLLRILGTAKKVLIDEPALHNAISDAYLLMKSLSVAEDDYLGRICAIISYVSSSTDWSKELPKPGKPKTFMANNFIVDVVIRARERHVTRNFDLEIPQYPLVEGWDNVVEFPTWPDLGLENQEAALMEFNSMFGVQGLF